VKMKKFIILTLLCLAILGLFAQNVVFFENFENSEEFPTTPTLGTAVYTNWARANATATVGWVRNDANSGPAGGSYSMYISDATNGLSGFPGYNRIFASRYHVSHLSRLVNIPAGADFIHLNFDIQCKGEDLYDYLRVYMMPVTTELTSYDGTAIGSYINATATDPNAQYRVGLDRYNPVTLTNPVGSWQNVDILIPNTWSGQSGLLVFTWRNNNNYGDATNPPAALDNISLITYTNSSAPLTVKSPSPRDKKNFVPLDTTLSWTPTNNGITPTGYTVYFGTSNPPTNVGVGDVSETSFTLTNELLPGTKYYWRVVPTHTNGSPTLADCPVWSFTTVPESYVAFNPGTAVGLNPAAPTRMVQLSQQLYQQSELETAGFTGGIITHVGFEAFSEIRMDRSYFNQWCIMIAETTTIDRIGYIDNAYHFLPYEDFTEVFRGVVSTAYVIPDEILSIELDTPFLYTGSGNLVICVNEYAPGGSAHYNFNISTGAFKGQVGSTTPGGAVQNSQTIANMITSPLPDPYIPIGDRAWSVSTTTASRPNIFLTIAPPSDFDLGIASLSVPSVIPGEADIEVTITNAGLIPAVSGDYEIKFYSVTQSGSVEIGSYTCNTTLPAVDDGVYASYTFSIPPATYNNWSNWGTPGSNITLRATVAHDTETDGNAINNSATAPVTLRPYTTDLQLVSFTPVGYLTSLEILVQNNGWTDIAEGEYTITLYDDDDDDDTPIFSYSGSSAVAIPMGASQLFSMSYAQLSSLYGSMTLRLEVATTTEDDYPDNDSRTASVQIFEHVESVGIVGSAISNALPFATYYHDNVTQSIYTADELSHTQGAITHISYRINMSYNISNPYPVFIYMANYGRPMGFTNANQWVPMDAFTLVADGIDLPIHTQGVYDIWIELDEPFLYEGGDLVVMTYKDHDFYPGNQGGWYQSPNGSRNWTLHKHRDNSQGDPYDPEDLVAGGSGELLPYKPQMRFAINIDGIGMVHGNITDADTHPIQDVIVTMGGAVVATTNDVGYYSLMVEIDSDAEIEFYKLGYVPQSVVINELAWTPNYDQGVEAIINDIVLAGASTVTVAGRVSFFDNDGDAEGVTVYLGETQSAITDSDGLYVIENVFTDAGYTVRVSSVEGYLTDMGSVYIAADDDTIEIGTGPNGSDVFTLDLAIPEAMRPPLYVHAVPTGINDEVSVKWFDPYYTSEPEMFSQLPDGGSGNTSTVGGSYSIPAHRFSATHIEDRGLEGSSIVSVGFIPYRADPGYSIIIWTGDDLTNPDVDNPTYFQNITQPLINDNWNEIALEVPVYIPAGEELLIGIVVTGFDCYVRSRSVPTSNTGYGDRIYQNTTWSNYGQVQNSWITWYIRAYAVKPLPHRSFASKYAVYRSIEGEDNYTEITPATYNNTLSFTDGPITTPALYRYAVRSVYAGSGYSGDASDGHDDPFTISAPAYSNLVSMLSAVNVTVVVSTEDGSTLNGAVLSVSPGGQTFNFSDGEPSTTLVLVPNQSYRISVSKPGFITYSTQQEFPEDEMIQVSLQSANTIFTEDFSSAGVPMGWTSLNADGDPYWWRFGFDLDGVDPTRRIAFSESQCQDTGECVYPDNWLVTPPITLPATTENLILSYSAAPNNIAKSQERLFVYITTAIAGTTPAWSDFLQNRVEPADPDGGWENENGAANGAERLNVEIFEAGNVSWRTITHEISEWAGEQVYIAFRHAHSVDQDVLKLADVSISMVDRLFDIGGSVVYGNENTPLTNGRVYFTNTTPGGYAPVYATTGTNGGFTLHAKAGTYSVRVEYTLSGQTQVWNRADTFTVIGNGTLYLNIGSLDESEQVTTPAVTALKTNYPNPFNPTTTIAFDLAHSGHVAIEIYNIKGQRVRVLANDMFVAGKHNVVWNGSDESGRSVGSGVYFYRMVAPGYSSVRKMLLMK